MPRFGLPARLGVIAAALALFAAMAPLTAWLNALRQTAGLALYALMVAATAVAVIQGSQSLWAPSAELTFRLVNILLKPLCPTLQSDPATLTLSTSRRPWVPCTRPVLGRPSITLQASPAP